MENYEMNTEEVYLLEDVDNGGRTILGVFSAPTVSDDRLREYFGEFTKGKLVDVRDSGIEWRLPISYEFGESVLVMSYYILDEF